MKLPDGHRQMIQKKNYPKSKVTVPKKLAGFFSSLRIKILRPHTSRILENMTSTNVISYFDYLESTHKVSIKAASALGNHLRVLKSLFCEKTDKKLDERTVRGCLRETKDVAANAAPIQLLKPLGTLTSSGSQPTSSYHHKKHTEPRKRKQPPSDSKGGKTATAHDRNDLSDVVMSDSSDDAPDETYENSDYGSTDSETINEDLLTRESDISDEYDDDDGNDDDSNDSDDDGLADSGYDSYYTKASPIVVL
ncbi:hypothetical protein AJ78_03735 [Emergomyces pasteurianus Ep9510]|uniref:Uncharacterized protein n=1 Tax=Emergomyces pasteurianus Ep9510 TaxID=1447872 RepID=A0A1J9PJ50_9EURO|nr:hypothetical protein AJ78_03735 [Emergomyces pasteurianus Ep9510]